jgi:hypothetical protein
MSEVLESPTSLRAHALELLRRATESNRPPVANYLAGLARAMVEKAVALEEGRNSRVGRRRRS